MKKVDDILKGGQVIVERSIKEELRDQGHYLTGNLERSFDADISDNELEGLASDYINKLNDGVPASEIKIDQQSLAEMARYVELRMGYRGGLAQKVALRILQKQQQEGMPTKNSYSYAKNGERKQALNRGFSNAEKELDDYILDGIDQLVNENFGKQKSETL